MRRALGLGLLVLFAAGCATSESAPRPGSVEQQAPTTERRRLRQALDRRIDAEDRGADVTVSEIDQEIAAKYQKTLAVMVTDMSGFTARTKKIGIVGFLAEVRRLFHLAEPVVARHGGRWVKVDADDLFVVTDDAASMFALALDLREAVRAHNATNTAHPIGLAIGLGFGPTLVVEHDVWGDSVNTASKLGEDVGQAGEILVSDAFLQALGPELAAKCQPVADYASRGSKYPFHSCP